MIVVFINSVLLRINLGKQAFNMSVKNFLGSMEVEISMIMQLEVKLWLKSFISPEGECLLVSILHQQQTLTTVDLTQYLSGGFSGRQHMFGTGEASMFKD